MYRLFIVEDDPGIANAVAAQAQAWNLQTHIVQDFSNVMHEFAEFSPHIVLLDIMLPFFDGYHWCSEIRRVSKVPIIFVSSASDNMNIVMAMNLGADDFISKPFDGSVLMAKIQALLRRTYDFGANVPVLEHRGALLDTGENSLVFGDEKITLTKNEYRILLCLLFGTEDSVNTRYPRDIVLSTGFDTIDGLDDGNIEKVAAGVDSLAASHKANASNFASYRSVVTVGTISDGGKLIAGDTGVTIGSNSNAYICFNVVPIEDYNAVMGTNETLAPDEVIVYGYRMKYKYDTVTLGDGKTYKVKKTVNSFLIDGDSAVNIASSIYIFVPDFKSAATDFAKPENHNGVRTVNYKYFRFFDTELDTAGERALCNDYIDATKPVMSSYGNMMSFSIDSRNAGRDDYYSAFGSLFYLGVMLSVVFIFAAVLIIYYKQVSEGYEDQSRFEIMQKVGMTKKEIRKSINSQLLTVFFLPLAGAGLHMIFASIIIRRILLAFNFNNSVLFAVTTLVCFVVFALFYTLIYRVTSNAYYKIVSGAKERE